MMLPGLNRVTRLPGRPAATSVYEGPANGDFATYVERLSRAGVVTPSTRKDNPLDSDAWGRDAFELDELSAKAGKEAVSAQKIVAQSPYVSADLSLPKGVRGEVEKVRERAARELKALQSRTSAAGGQGKKPASGAGGEPEPVGKSRVDATRRTQVLRIWSFIKWTFILLFVLPWLFRLLKALF